MAGHDHTPALHGHADSWHHHDSAEGVPQHEHAATANAGILFYWFVLIVISMVTVIVALLMYFGRYHAMARQEKVETLVFYNDNALPRLVGAEAALGTDKPLAQYKYAPADKAAHTVQLPIQQAMQKVVTKYQTAK